MRTLRLREWTPTTSVELTASQRDALRRQLRAVVEPTVGVADCYDVTPGNVVGALLVDDVTLLVEPKLPISRLLFLLGYAANPHGWRDDAPILGEAPDLVTGVAGLFTALCERALYRGLLTGYHDVADDLVTVRGRIDLTEQLRSRPGLDLPLAVRYAEHDEDVLENRLLLAATLQLSRLPIRSTGIRRTLHRIVATLEPVTLTYFPPGAVPTVTWTRLNSHYRTAVEVARLLLQLRTPELRPGDVRAAGLTLDMALLFETFVRTALRDALQATSTAFPSGKHCPPLYLDAARHVRLRPDLSYWPAGRCVFVGDVKYKRDPGPGQQADLYQMLAYATATQLPRAMLVYADGPPAPRAHVVAPPQIRLQIRHLDLRQPPAGILDQIAELAGEAKSSAVLTVSSSARG